MQETYDKKNSIFRSEPVHSKRINNRGEQHNLRDAFDRDRDRIMYSKAFRRLSGKTQVFLAGKDDHTRNRLTHTLEVSQIARTIAKAVGLNETLTEAIALGHDIGHTPFGHVGERMLDKIMSGCYELQGFEEAQKMCGYTGFKHNWQSVKVASLLEDNLDLTTYTLWGMLNHSKLKYSKPGKECAYKKELREDESSEYDCCFRQDKQKKCTYNIKDELSYYREYMTWEKSGSHLGKINDYIQDKEAWNLEGYIVATADEIAQRHHDIEDAIEYKLFNVNDLVDKLKDILKECIKENSEYYTQKCVLDTEEWKMSFEEHQYNFKKLKDAIDSGEKEKILALSSKFIVNLLTSDAIYNMRYQLDCLRGKYKEQFRDKQSFEEIKDYIFEDKKTFKCLFSLKMQEYDSELQELLKNRILNSYEAQKMDGIGQYIIRGLFRAYLTNPQQLPNNQIPYLFNRYYSFKYGCGYKEVLITEGYLKNGGWDIGKMRDQLAKLHAKQEDQKYKVALLRSICDYIAGMTDKHAMEKHRELYNIEYK